MCICERIFLQQPDSETYQRKRNRDDKEGKNALLQLLVTRHLLPRNGAEAETDGYHTVEKNTNYRQRNSRYQALPSKPFIDRIQKRRIHLYNAQLIMRLDVQTLFLLQLMIALLLGERALFWICADKTCKIHSEPLFQSLVQLSFQRRQVPISLRREFPPWTPLHPVLDRVIFYTLDNQANSYHDEH